MRKFVLLASLLTGLAIPTFSQAETSNWNPWRGPDGDGVAQSNELPLTWSTTENVRWKAPIAGKGSSTPIIWGDKIFILTAVNTGKSNAAETTPPAAGGRPERGRGMSEPVPTTPFDFVIVCYDRTNGKVIWQEVATTEIPHEGGHSTNNFASSSPVTDGKYVYADFGSRGIFCFDMNGKKIWGIDLGQMQTRASFGEGSSPALYGDTLIVPWDHEGQSYLVALNSKTGAELWRTPRDEQTSWATPLIVEHKGVVQVITNGTRVRSYDLADGKLIWECGGQVQNPIPTPVKYGDQVICMTGYRGDAIQSISLDSKGDVTGQPSIKWSRDDAAPYVPSPALYKDTLYFVKQNNAIISSVNAQNGEVILKPQRLPDIEMLYSSPLAANGRVYFTGRDGTTVVIKHGPELEVLATNRIGETVDSSLAVSGNEIFLRTESNLYCIAE